MQGVAAGLKVGEVEVHFKPNSELEGLPVGGCRQLFQFKKKQASFNNGLLYVLKAMPPYTGPFGKRSVFGRCEL